MADNTRLKELSVNMSKMLEMLEADRQENKARFETLEAAMDTLLKSNNAGVNLHMNVAGNNSIGGSSSPPPFQVRNVKLDFPRFDGSEVLQWIFKAEQFFDYYNTPDTQRLTITAIHTEKR